MTATLEPQPSSLPRFSQLNSAVISAVPMPGTSIGDAVQWLQDNAKNTLPQGYNYDFKGEARQLVQEGSCTCSNIFTCSSDYFLSLGDSV